MALFTKRKHFKTLLLLITIFFCLESFKRMEKQKEPTKTEANQSVRIFFHETSGVLKLDLKQCCAVESAAKHNPARPVQVYLSQPYQTRSDAKGLSGDWFAVLRNYPNVAVITIDLYEYFRGSPLEKWYDNGIWRSSPYKIVHLSDYIRMLSLYKGGGFYLDLDVISIRPIGDLSNFFVLEDRNCSIVANSVLHLEHGHTFIELIMTHLSDEYDPDDWVFHGSAIMTAIMRDNCGFKKFQVPPINKCGDLVKLLAYQSFFPITPENYGILIQKTTRDALRLIKESYGVHVWNSKLRHDFIDMRSDQLFVELMKEHCPLTYSKLAMKCK